MNANYELAILDAIGQTHDREKAKIAIKRETLKELSSSFEVDVSLHADVELVIGYVLARHQYSLMVDDIEVTFVSRDALRALKVKDEAAKAIKSDLCERAAVTTKRWWQDWGMVLVELSQQPEGKLRRELLGELVKQGKENVRRIMLMIEDDDFERVQLRKIVEGTVFKGELQGW